MLFNDMNKTRTVVTERTMNKTKDIVKALELRGY